VASVAEAVITDAAASWATAAYFCAEGERLGWVAGVIELFIAEADRDYDRAYSAYLAAHGRPAEWTPDDRG
jgi:hypothetical protein